MVHKTKKYNRWKKFKDTKRRYTKKQNYYGGAMPSASNMMSSAGNNLSSAGNKISNASDKMSNANNMMMYGPAGTYQFSGNMVQPDVNNYQEHDTGLLNDVGQGLNYVGSKVTDVNSGIHDFNQKTDDAKQSIADGLDKVASGSYEVVKDVVSDVASLLDFDTIKQASVASSIIIDAMEEPLVEAAKVSNQVFEVLAANAGTTAVNVLTDVAAATPGVGAIIEIPKLANDAVYGAAAGIEAGAQLIDIIGTVVDATEKNIDKTVETLKKIEETGNYALQEGSTAGDDELEQLGQQFGQPGLGGPGLGEPGLGQPGFGQPGLGQPGLGQPGLGGPGLGRPMKIGGFKNFTKQKAQIGGRINDSIAEFADPIGYQSVLKGGNNKTKKSFVKNRKANSRRVHFSL